ncbi:MAG: hypothetical protein ACLGHT_03900 [Acidimicrobiia bacterium]
MATFVVRVWIPDRPGALGAVASRIGAVRGDVVGIDILERGAGRAIDELVVDLPEASLVELMVGEINEVDGVDVEEVRPLAGEWIDPRVEALESAAVISEQMTCAELLTMLAERAAHDFGADWAAVVGTASADVVSWGTPPSRPWLEAFAFGSDVAGADAGPDDVVCAGMPHARVSLVLGRSGRPFRARERRQLAALARIADARWVALAVAPSRAAHPSAG